MERFEAFSFLFPLSWGILFGTSLSFSAHVPFATAQVKPALDSIGTQVTDNGSQFDITGGQISSDRHNLFHSFEEFGLTADQIANFTIHPDIQNVLGRVVGGQASIIDGLIQVTGGNANLYLMNPAGMVFGPNAQLNVPGDFTATTATGIGFGDQWFHAVGDVDYGALSGTPNAFAFTGLSTGDSADSFGTIINTGALTLEPTQTLMLLGGSVINTGTLQVPGGQITVAAVPNDNLVRISQDNMVLSLEMETLASDQNLGFAAGLSQSTDFSPLSLPELLTASGPEAATHVQVLSNGNVQLRETGIAIPFTEGAAIASQTLDTSSSFVSPIPSTINVLGKTIALVDTHLSTSMPNQGGTIQIGGNFQGQGPLPNAEYVFVSNGTDLNANALDTGDGGEVIIWADRSTQFYGTVEAQGGRYSGNGGFVEVSGKEGLDFQGTVNTTAPQGATGTLLLDPQDILIVDPENEVPNSTETTVLFNADPQTTIIAASTIEAASTDVVLQANNDIIVEDDIDTSTNGNSIDLTLQAGRNIEVNASILLQDGSFSAIINDEGADPNQRDLGVATFSLGPGETIEILGAGDISVDHGAFESTHLSNPDSGEIFLEGTLITDSGKILLQGTGAAPTDGTIFGDGTGVTLVNANIETATGNIQIDGVGGGTTTGTAFNGTGIFVDENSTVNVTTSGTLTLNGTGGNSDGDNSGVQLDGSLSVNNGNLIVEGSGGGFAGGAATPGSGIFLNGSSRVELVNSVATLTGNSGAGTNDISVAGIDAVDFELSLEGSDITINGQHDQPLNGPHTGVSLEGGFIDAVNESTLSINGSVKQGDGNGVYLADMNISASDVTIQGTSVSPSNTMSGVVIQSSLIAADNGLLITGEAETTTGIRAAESSVESLTGTIQLTANDIELENTFLNGSDILHIQPLEANADISLVDIAETGTGLELDSTELDGIGDGFAEIQIGRDDGTGTITATGDLFFPAPVLLQVPQGNGQIDASDSSLISSSTLDNGSIHLLAGGDIRVRDLSTNIEVIIEGDGPFIDGDGSFIDGDGPFIDGDDPFIDGEADSGSTTDQSIILDAGQGIVVQGIIDAGTVNSLTADDGGSIVLGAGQSIQIGVNGLLDTSAISDGGLVGNGGLIELTAGTDIINNGLIQAESFNLDGEAGNGGSVQIMADGAVQILNDIYVSSEATNGISGDGGQILIDAGQTLAIAALLDTSSQNDTESSGSGGAIAATAVQNLTWTGNWDTTSEANDIGGDVTLTSETGQLVLFLTTADNTDNRQSGAVTLTSKTGLSLNINHAGSATPALSSTGNPIEITSDGPIQMTSAAATPFTLATEGATLKISGSDLKLTNVNLSTAQENGVGGELTLQASTGAITTGNLDSSGTTGGNINVLATTAITTGTINSSGTQGDGGTVILDPSGDIQVGFINAEGGTNGTGGNVDITTGSLFRATDTFVSQNGRTASISTVGGQGGGDIIIRYGSGMDTPFTIGDARLPTRHGTAGEVTTATHVLESGESFVGGLTRGNIQLETETIPTQSAPPATTPDNASNNTIAPLSTPNTPSSSPSPNPSNPNSNSPNSPNSPTNQRPNSSTPTQNPTSRNPSSPVPTLPRQSNHFVHTANHQQAPQAAGSEFSSEFEQHLAMEDFEIELDSIEDLESGVVDDFSEHFDMPLGVPQISVGDAQNELRKIQSHTGVSPALIYAQFVPTLSPTDHLTNGVNLSHLDGQGTDQLELMVVSASGPPTRIRVEGATRNKVERVVRQFQSDITSPIRRNSDRYLSTSQTLYQWLISPLEETLAAEGIENLSFILDSGLRSLPMAALHDGKQFLIEKYSVGMMPSLSLTDTRYVDTRDLGVLAMGASEFEEQAPLPAVPIELETITEDVWENGVYFLNQDFTVANLKAQRQETPYGIVHLATHGEFRSGAPENSYLQLGDRTLHLNDLRELGFNDPTVELLVLSACRTALGDDHAELGFAGLALQAGVKSVMASLWYVSDAGALGLTTEFYRQLKETPIKAEALRQAQLAMIRGEIALDGEILRSVRGGNIALPDAVELEASMDLSHPFYWSAFTMIGSPW